MLLMFVSAAAGSAVTLAPLLHLLYYFSSHGGQYNADIKLKVATIAAYVAALALSISSVLLAKS